MLEFHIENIFGNQVFTQSVGIPFGTNCDPLLADQVCILMRQNIFKKPLYEEEKYLAVALNSKFRYIDEVLSIEKTYFHLYVNPIYPSELEIKCTT